MASPNCMTAKSYKYVTYSYVVSYVINKAFTVI